MDSSGAHRLYRLDYTGWLGTTVNYWLRQSALRGSRTRYIYGDQAYIPSDGALARRTAPLLQT